VQKRPFPKPKLLSVKFDNHLAKYLYENKFLKLEGIGTFTFDSKASLPNQQDKEIYYPIDGLSFTYNPKEVLDETLITFLVKRLGKIEPLVRSDLDSDLSNIKQFINLGKPYTIEGIGTLNKNNQGTYEFTPGSFLPAKEELNPKRENAEHNYPVSSNGSAGKIFVIILIIIASIAALGGIGLGISTFMSRKANDDNSVTQKQQSQADTVPTEQGEPISNTATVDISKSNVTISDTVGYKMIFEITANAQRAIVRKEKLKEQHIDYDTTSTAGVLKYRLYVPMRIRPEDTTRTKDSLRKWYARRIVIDKL
jgi:flagellar basal body-associated protein FliL